VSDAEFRALARAASACYPRGDRFARHFAYGKLTGDPAFAWLLAERFVADGARVVDVGCGQGLVAALLGAAGVRPASYTGIELNARDAARARHVAWASIVHGDMRAAEIPAADVILMLDVLHYIPPEDQERLLDRAARALAPTGVLVLRAADATGSARARWTLLVDRLATRLRGMPSTLWPRPIAAWRVALERRGLEVAERPMSEGTLFANVALVARYDSRA
jgi:SAM-dependent methyltransferase